MRWLLPLFAAITLIACSVVPQAYANGQVDKLTVSEHFELFSQAEYDRLCQQLVVSPSVL